MEVQIPSVANNYMDNLFELQKLMGADPEFCGTSCTVCGGATLNCTQALILRVRELESGLKALINKFDKLEDNNHNAAGIAEGLHAKDVFSTAGTTYGICAEELRIVIGFSGKEL